MFAALQAANGQQDLFQNPSFPVSHQIPPPLSVRDISTCYGTQGRLNGALQEKLDVLSRSLVFLWIHLANKNTWAELNDIQGNI